MNTHRHPVGGTISRDHPIAFRFDGKAYSAYKGDTLASALLANGVRIVGRSFKYHRPRGVFGMGVEEPSSMVQLRSGPRSEPNIRATEVELFDGLEAFSQHCWPSVNLDFGALINFLSPIVPSGFYYKTFMWPASKWMFYEHFIRKAAGLGKSATEHDPDTYSKFYQYCDVLVVGAGPTGLSAALGAGKSGARVVVVEETGRTGGRLNLDDEMIDGKPAQEWVYDTTQKLRIMPNVEILCRTTAFGLYDQNLVGALERVADHQREPDGRDDRHRLRSIRARQIVLATGSIERSIPFGGNDKPGVMLASAVRGYANRFAVRCGKKAVVFTNNDSAYATVSALRDVGVTVEAVIDCRLASPGESALRHLGNTPLKQGFVITRVRGLRQVRSVEVSRLQENGEIAGSAETLNCDLVCVSGGWTPTVHLFSHAQGKLRFDEQIGAYLPEHQLESLGVAGSANGEMDLGACLRQGSEIGSGSAAQAGFRSEPQTDFPKVEDSSVTPMQQLWQVPKVKRGAKRFVDIQNDVTVEDIELAFSEGYVSVEHLKRYTTLGMGTDQGRTSNINGLANLARLRDSDIPSVGHTTFRPPYTPVSMGALAGVDQGKHLSALRRTPLHEWHVRNRAQMHNAGLWQRPYYYMKTGEQIRDAIIRESRQVREKVGIADVSTLGKIEIQGRDAAEFLERIYINRWKSLPVGRVRYGLMLREDGFVFDDGTTTRVAENEYYMTTTTANAAPVLEHMEFYAQTVWPELHVHLTSISDQWAGMALAGPHSRKVLGALIGETEAGNDNLPFMGYLESRIDDIAVRIFRVSFSGELGYEIHIPSKFAQKVWQAVLEAGREWDIAPYGMEAMTVLRIEKGHVVSAELDGRTTAGDLGFERMMKKDEDFVGKRLAEREALVSSGREQLVGVESLSGRPIPKGAQIVAASDTRPPAETRGHVTSSCYSPLLDKEIGLALIADGRQIYGTELYAASPLTGRTVPVKVAHHIFVDPQGERTRG
ncbi:MAG: sarcosine oxidase subunit alpha family protein [Acidiferrobacterales bacterium]|nr:sarcosine oxidase subunit alpha family protein [Acidiferrobacterales bacterium]